MAGRRGAGTSLLRLGAGSEIADLSNASALRETWHRLHRITAPAALSPDFLRRDIAYRQQADRQGGLSAKARQRLVALAGGDAHPASARRAATPRLKPGSTLLREWRGRTYTVLALGHGFEMAGQRFTSLSEIAHHITGAHWSGPRFFGLRRGGASPTPRTAREPAVDA